MRIVISGGTGLVGRALIHELRSAGHSCVVLTRAVDRHTDLREVAALEPWDARSEEPLAGPIEGADAVVHLAGESIGAGRWTAERKRRILDSRVESTRAMVRAMQANGNRPGIFVQASAVGYYGPRDDELITEGATPGDDYLARVCREWEAASAELDSTGVRRVVLRTGIVLSREGGALPRMALPFKLLVGGPAGSGRQWMPWIHLADEVGAIRFLIESSASGPFNLTAPEPVTNRVFSRTLASVLRRPGFMPAPAPALRLLLGEMADLILTGQRAVPARLLDLGYAFRFADLEDALRDIYGG